MPIDPAIAALGTVCAALTATAATLYHNLKKLRTEEKTADAGAIKAEAEAGKAEAETEKLKSQAQAEVFRAVAEWGEKTSGASTDLMERYAKVLEEMGTLKGAVGGLRAELATVRAEVTALRADKDRAEKAATSALKEANRCRHECERLTKENALLSIELYVAIEGYEAAMLRWQGANNQMIDMAMEMTTDAQIKKAAELAAELAEKRRQTVSAPSSTHGKETPQP